MSSGVEFAVNELELLFDDVEDHLNATRARVALPYEKATLSCQSRLIVQAPSLGAHVRCVARVAQGACTMDAMQCMEMAWPRCGFGTHVGYTGPVLTAASVPRTARWRAMCWG